MPKKWEVEQKLHPIGQPTEGMRVAATSPGAVEWAASRGLSILKERYVEIATSESARENLFGKAGA